MRERELADRGHATGHSRTLLADLDAKITAMTARAQLDDDAEAYRVEISVSDGKRVGCEDGDNGVGLADCE